MRGTPKPAPGQERRQGASGIPAVERATAKVFRIGTAPSNQTADRPLLGETETQVKACFQLPLAGYFVRNRVLEVIRALADGTLRDSEAGAVIRNINK